MTPKAQQQQQQQNVELDQNLTLLCIKGHYQGAEKTA